MNFAACQPHILLTGAGFTHNFGGFLAREMWAHIFNHRIVQDQPRVRQLLLDDAYDFESTYYKVLHQTAEPPYTATEQEAIVAGVAAAYDLIDDVVRNTTFVPASRIDIYKVQEFIAAFQGGPESPGFVFTLNQDLFVERWQHNYGIPFLPGIGPPGQVRTAAVARQPVQPDGLCPVPCLADVQRLRNELPPGPFCYLKLHGSQNWITADGMRRMVVGRDKVDQIQREPILAWYYDVFGQVLNTTADLYRRSGSNASRLFLCERYAM